MTRLSPNEIDTPCGEPPFYSFNASGSEGRSLESRSRSIKSPGERGG
jgi:hypothetical protein